MKNHKPLSLVLATVLLLASIFSCSDTCETTVTTTVYNPVFSSKADIRNGVSLESGRQVSASGKIFFRRGYLFINEPKNGIHIIDNRDPSSPQNVAFLKVPGSFDIAVKGDYLFTDSYMDLVTFDISDLSAITEVNRIEDYFTAHGNLYYASSSESSVVMTDLIPEEVTTENMQCSAWNPGWFQLTNGNFAFALEDGASPGQGFAKAPGIAGSLARFALTEEHLYVLDGGNVKSMNIQSPLSPVAGNELYTAWDVETLFPRGDELFVGAASGMHILDISDRSNPELISTYTHINSCDPVIVDGNLAFVTLRSGTECDGFTNQLEVIDISDLRNPTQLHVFPMFNPHGLSKDGHTLFICDGTDGLKVFNTQDLSAIDQNLLAHDPSIQAYDIVAYDDIAMVIGDDGLFQYDYSDLNDIKLLSTINILSND